MWYYNILCLVPYKIAKIQKNDDTSWELLLLWVSKTGFPTQKFAIRQFLQSIISIVKCKVTYLNFQNRQKSFFIYNKKAACSIYNKIVYRNNYVSFLRIKYNFSSVMGHLGANFIANFFFAQKVIRN